MNAENEIKILAIYSRLCVIVIQYFSNILIPDHNADAFLYPKTYTNHTVLDKTIEHFLGGFVRWDAQYFMHIVKYGYTFENTLAFFPLYPITVRLASLVVYSVVPAVNLDSVLLLISVGLNTVLFVLATKVLYKLTAIIFNETIAYKTALLFCFNPASVFFTAPYSECMFTYLTFQSILNCLILYKKYSTRDCKMYCTDIIYLLPIALSAIVRSNGILNIGFLAYTCVCIYFKHYLKTSCSLRISLKYILITFSLLIACLVPFIAFQIYCYRTFCTNFEAKLPEMILSYAEENSFILPGQFFKYNQSWCYGGLAYSYVQDHYWNVGFLRYYKLKQIPNFLLALPVLFVLIKHCFQHIKFNFTTNIVDVFSFDKLFIKENKFDAIFGPRLNVFVIHALALAVFCTLFMHIQVATRMLCSATPLFYWICASYLKDTKFGNIKDVFYNNSLEECIIKVYFIGYFVIGTILFSNFLPWT